MDRTVNGRVPPHAGKPKTAPQPQPGPPPYRPFAAPATAQRKTTGAPEPYRPQPAANLQRSTAPAPYRPQPLKVVQPKIPPSVRRVVPGFIQMLPVSGEIVEGEVGRGSHHPYYSFKIGGGEAVRHDLDPWITKTGTPAYIDQNRSTFIGRSERKSLRKKLETVVKAWDGSKSVVHPLLKAFYGVATETWTDWDIDPDDVQLATPEARQSLVRHLLALQANIVLRENDIPANCYNVDLTTKPRVGEETTERISIGWKSLLKDARVLLKAQLQTKTASPGAPGSVTLLKTAVASTTDAGIVKLKALGLLGTEMELETESKRIGQNLYTAAGSGAKSFNFGYGHVRFILFLEWRIVDDLRKLFA